MHDVSLAYLHELASLGYNHLSLDQLVDMRIHGVSTSYIRGFRGLGYSLSPDELVDMRIHGVTREFATSLKTQDTARFRPISSFSYRFTESLRNI